MNTIGRQLVDFIDDLDVSDFMRGYIYHLLVPPIENESFLDLIYPLKETKVDIPDFMKGDKN